MPSDEAIQENKNCQAEDTKGKAKKLIAVAVIISSSRRAAIFRSLFRCTNPCFSVLVLMYIYLYNHWLIPY